MNRQEEQYFYDLVTASVHGTIKPEEHAKLMNILLSDSEAMAHYSAYISFLSVFRTTDLLKDIDAEEIMDMSLWRALAEEERNAPAIEIPKEKPVPEVIRVAEPSRVTQKVSKFSIITLITSVAAMVLLMLFIKFAPPVGLVEVATITDSINAKWDYADVALQNDFRLTASSGKLVLLEGLVELTFDNHVKAVIEGPSEFQILADDRIGLGVGKVYATVPPNAIGFSIYTPNAKVIDLGTEFAVQADTDGDTRLYVFKGKTSLIAGDESNRVSIEVAKDSAKRVSGSTASVSDIAFVQDSFVRDINSKTDTILRGGDVELSSIIAGGNGLSPFLDYVTLNPNTGLYDSEPLSIAAYTSNHAYNNVPHNVFIDGVFVPDGSDGPITITSDGHLFDCPSTSGNFNRNIVAFYQHYDDSIAGINPGSFDGVVYGSQQHPCVLMHSNVGITIDLNRIRQILPDHKIEQLQTGYGLQWPESKGGRVDFFVLVDGVLKHKEEAMPCEQTLQAHPLNLALEPEDRFLTFIVTDNKESAPVDDRENAHLCDVFFLLDPRLILH